MENPLDFGEGLDILDIGDDADDVEDDINGFQHLFDNWNDSKREKLLMRSLKILIKRN